MDRFKVRTAGYEDVVALVELRAEMFTDMGVSEHDRGWREHARRWFADRIENASYHFVVVEAEGDVVACAIGAVRDSAPSPTEPGGGDVLISNVCTRRAARGQGFGSAAFEAVMDWARRSGAGRAELLATPHGEAMYRHSGFVRSDYPVMRAVIQQTTDQDGLHLRRN